jgi:hypothetical protein
VTAQNHGVAKAAGGPEKAAGGPDQPSGKDGEAGGTKDAVGPKEAAGGPDHPSGKDGEAGGRKEASGGGEDPSQEYESAAESRGKKSIGAGEASAGGGGSDGAEGSDDGNEGHDEGGGDKDAEVEVDVQHATVDPNEKGECKRDPKFWAPPLKLPTGGLSTLRGYGRPSSNGARKGEAPQRLRTFPPQSSSRRAKLRTARPPPGGPRWVTRR